MATYNTYQEAQIANPEYAIFEYQGDFGTDKEILDLFDIQGREMKECNPADYCMTVDKFLADGHKFVDGDLYQNEDGRVFTVGSLGYEAKYCNLLSSYCFTSKILILRAAALESIPAETPQQHEERERLEAAYDLYAHVQSVRGKLLCKFDWFFSSEMEEIRLRFLAIVDKTNYRKDKTHGTN